MRDGAAVLLLVGLLVAGACRADEEDGPWPEPPPSRFEVRLHLPGTEGLAEPVGSTWDALTPSVQPTEPRKRELPPPERQWLLQEAAEALGRLPSPAEQGGADIQYCPDYRPQLYPELTLGQMCSDSLLSSPLLAQGKEGQNPFGMAFDEVRRMDQSRRRLAKKALLAGAYYWQHRRSAGALDGAARAMIVEESTDVLNILLNTVVPPVVKLLPRELSGIPPYEELGPAYDIRISSPASYNSVADIETTLRSAGERGLDGIAITDLDHVDGVRDAEAVAARLKGEGLLPETFLVIPGEEVETLSGPVIGLFLQDRVQRGMTIKATINEIHRQGGVAIVADPGTGSGTKLVRTLNVDGYLLRSHTTSLLRTLELIGDTDATVKPLLAASGSRAGGSVGVPYTVAETQHRSAEGVREAFREHRTFGATGIQMPLMTLMVFRPFVAYERTMAFYFRARDKLEEVVAQLIGSDNVEIRTSYDKEMANLLGVVGARRVFGDMLEGSASLAHTPRMERISADYGYVRVEYRWDDRTLRVMGAVTW